MINISEYYSLESSLNESIYNNNNDSLDILLEMLSFRLDSDDFYMPLTENITIINTFSEYMPLIEAVDVVNDLNKSTNELKKAPNENVFNKVFKSLKNLVNWYYKIEPDKKYKTFHTVLRIVMKILVWLLSMYVSKKVGFAIAGKIENTAKFQNISDNAVKSLSSVLEPEKTKKMLNLLLGGVMASIIQSLLDPIRALSDKVEYEINKKDLDKNIKELDNSIEIINKKLSNDKLPPEVKEKLIKARENLSSTLAKLIKLKDKHNKGI